MKSYNHLYEKFISDENIKLAIKNACKHKLNRKKFRDLHDNPEKYIDWIMYLLRDLQDTSISNT